MRVQLARKGSAVGKSAGKMMGFFVALLLVALPLAGCSCSRQEADPAASQASSASAGASSASASSDDAASASSDDVDAEEGSGESIDEAPSSGDSSASNQAGGSDSSCAEVPSAPSGGSSDGDSGSGASEPQPAAHEHSWEWVPQWVDVVHREAYDEPVYRWAIWCYKCDVEVAKSHNEEMLLKGETGHTLTELKVLDHYEYHDAETHQEDHGYYRCSTCGETY